MKKVKSLILRSRSMLSYLFFAVVMLFNLKNIKKILKDMYIVNSSAFLRIVEVMEISLQNGLIKPLLSKMHSLKNKRIR